MNGTQAADDARERTSTAAHTGTDEWIEAERSRIDEIDARLLALVEERKSVSVGIQQARIDAGGRRLHLAREMQVLDHYRRELGRPGTQLAMMLLGFCRGAL